MPITVPSKTLGLTFTEKYSHNKGKYCSTREFISTICNHVLDLVCKMSLTSAGVSGDTDLPSVAPNSNTWQNVSHIETNYQFVWLTAVIF